MILLSFRSLINRRSGSVGRRSYLCVRRRVWRVAPRLLALEVRALLSTITVTNDADSGSGSLRQALVSAVAGDTIQFARSAYGTITLSSGPLVVASSVTIDGPGAKNLTIDGNNTFQDLQVQAGVTARVSGMTITGGEAPTGYPYAGGGVLNAGTLTLANCVVTKNSAPGEDGGGGIASSGSLTITGSVVSGNTAGTGGGISSIGTLVVEDSTIDDNSAAYGGGVSSYRGDVSLSNCVVSGNSGEFGGGVSGYQGDVSLTNCVVSGNAGGGVVNTGEVTNLTNCSVTGSTPIDSRGGSGIDCYSGDLNVVNCVVSGDVGGISISGSTYGSSIATVTVTNSSIVNNTINNSANGNVAQGGGIASLNADVTITGSLIADNTVSSDLALGAGIEMASTFFTVDAANVLTVSDTTFLGNQVIGTGSFGRGFGGAIDAGQFTTVSLTNCSFLNNSVTGTGPVQGGALDLQELVKGTITDSQFKGNEAVVSNSSTDNGASALGGAICNTGAFFFSTGVLTISGSTFTKNLVQGGPGGGFGQGGAILSQFNGATLDLSSSLLLDNSAIGGAGATAGAFVAGGWGTGGAIVNDLGSIAAVADSSFVGNTAIGGAASVVGSQGGPGEGGAILSEGATLMLLDSNILGNVAIGGAGSNGALGGNGEGGGLENVFGGSPFTVTGGTIIGNSAIGGAGGGDGEGGGVFSSGSAAFSGVLITLNSAIGGSGGGKGVGGGLYIAAGTVTLSPSTKVVGNYATTSNDNIFIF